MITPEQEKWLQALESDEFKQTQGCLQDEGGFCCLGVACVVAEREGVSVSRNYKTVRLFGVTLSNQEHVQRWLKLNDPLGSSISLRKHESLMALNDQGVPFKEIAKIIRANPEAYFVTPEPDHRGPIETGSLCGV